MTQHTPWGYADYVNELSKDVVFYGTPSHGGFYVSPAALHYIPKEWQAYARKWSGSPHWYEEDCAWCAVALSFPELFTDHELNVARDLAEKYLVQS